MAGYSTSNPPAQCSEGIWNQIPATWVYNSVDAAALVQVAGYITNGDALGMKVNDKVEVTDSDTGLLTRHIVISVTAGGSADLSDAFTASDITNSD